LGLKEYYQELCPASGPDTECNLWTTDSQKCCNLLCWGCTWFGRNDGATTK